MVVEIGVDSLESALLAENAGAHRLELCSHLQTGGLTPSYGLLKEVKTNIRLPVHVMIRPRAGDFFYSDNEFKVMKSDIGLVREFGFEGIVFGMLLKDGSPDIIRIREIVHLAGPMKTVFHRAFDVCADPFKAIEDLMLCGIDILLTSGQKDKAVDGIDLISKLITRASSGIQVLVGSGITADNLFKIAEQTGATQFHLTARKMCPDQMIFQNKNVQFGSDDDHRYLADEQLIKRIIRLINK